MVFQNAPERIPSALYADLFYSNPGAAEFRQDHLEVWIQVFLNESTEEFPPEALAAEFEAAYPGCRVELEVVNYVLTHLESNHRILKTESGSYTLTPSGRAGVESAQRRFTSSRNTLFSRIVGRVEEVTRASVSSDTAARIEHCAERLLIAALLGERSALERLYVNVDDFTGLANRAQERQEQLAACLLESFPDELSTRLIELRRAILLSIGECEREERAYLHTLHRSVLGSFFLIQDPHHVENIRNVVKGREYFLDTNVYMAWIYQSQLPHGVVKPLLDLLRGYGVRISLLTETVGEITRIEQDARRVALRAESDLELARYLVRKRKAISADYLTARNLDRNLTFPVWERLFTGVERISTVLGVENTIIEFEPNETFLEDAPSFRNAIRGCKEDAGHFPREEAVDHDVMALLKMAKVQLRGGRDAWGSKVRFLSLDSTLNPALREVRNVLNRRYESVDSPFMLASIVLPTAAHELSRESYEEYVVTTIQHDLGLMVEMRGYSDVYFIDKLQKAGLPVKTLLDAPADLVEPVLTELQGRVGLGRKLDQALTTVDPATRQALVSDLGKEIVDAIAFRSDLQSETERRLIEEQQARSQVASDLADLSDRFNRLYSQIDLQRASADKHAMEAEREAQARQELLMANRKLQRHNRVLFAGLFVLALLSLMALVLGR